MSRSYMKSFFTGNCSKSASEKNDKSKANRRFRRIGKSVLNTTLDETKLPVNKNETSNIWDFNKDGKSYFGNMQYGISKYRDSEVVKAEFKKLKRK